MGDVPSAHTHGPWNTPYESRICDFLEELVGRNWPQPTVIRMTPLTYHRITGQSWRTGGTAAGHKVEIDTEMINGDVLMRFPRFYPSKRVRLAEGYIPWE